MKGTNIELQPIFFETQSDFRTWLEDNHGISAEIFVGFYKVNSGKRSMTWSQSVDQALCFGWIDGVRKSVDEESYFIRFTPRKAASIWSVVNIKKVEELTQQGLMRPEGIASFKLRKEHKSRIYAYEQETIKFSIDFEKRFKSNKKAWDYFQTLPPSYHKPAINWVMTAKRDETRIKRLQELIDDSEAGRKIKMLSY